MESQRAGHDWATELNWSYSLQWEWKAFSHVQLFVTPWTIQSMEFSRPDYWKWVAFPFRGSSQPRVRTQLSCIAGRFFTSWVTGEVLYSQIFIFQTTSQSSWICRSEACFLSGFDYGILVPWPGIKCTSPALRAQSLNQWISREVLTSHIFDNSCFLMPFFS